MKRDSWPHSGLEDVLGMDPTKHHAAGWINVTSFDSKPYDEADGLSIAEVRVVEEFTGDFAGTGTVRFLIVTHPDGGGHFTGMERFVGKLGELTGSFIMRNSGLLKDGVVHSEWMVIPGSGTGELRRLRGVGGCRGTDGVFLDYWFE
jgi:hypothetical protein